MNEERAKRIKDKQDKFLAEIAEDLLDPETIKSTEETIKKIFKKTSVPYTRASLKAFSEGSQIILAAQHGAGESTKKYARKLKS